MVPQPAQVFDEGNQRSAMTSSVPYQVAAGGQVATCLRRYAATSSTTVVTVSTRHTAAPM